MAFDLVIRNGCIVAGTQVVEGDIGVRNGMIATIGHALPAGKLGAERGSGRYLRRASPDVMRAVPVGRPTRPHGRVLKTLIGLGVGGDAA